MSGNNPLTNFERTILPHLNAAYNLARHLTRNHHDAEDVVQEAYLRAFRFYSSFRGGDARAWVLTIVRNTCLTWLNASRTLRSATEFDEKAFPPDPGAPNPENLALLNDNGNLMRTALENIAPNFRQILVLREIEGMSYREIAEFTGVPLGTVMSSLSRARARLHHVLTDLLDADLVGAQP